MYWVIGFVLSLNVPFPELTHNRLLLRDAVPLRSTDVVSSHSVWSGPASIVGGSAKVIVRES